MGDEEVGNNLMRVIHTLSMSNSGQQREEEKQKLQASFRQTDINIDRMIMDHQRNITRVMQLHARVSSRLASSRAKVQAIRAGLHTCRELLHYKRDDLKRHWLDGIEQKHVVQTLHKIKDVKELPERVDSLMGRERWLSAAQALASHTKYLDQDLRQVDGLMEIKGAIDHKQELLFNRLMTDLDGILYGTANADILRHYVSNLNTIEGGEGEQRSVLRDKFLYDLKLLDVLPFRSRFGAEMKTLRELTFALTEANRELLTRPNEDKMEDGGPIAKMNVLVESLVVLGRINDCVERLSDERESRLRTIIHQSTQAFTQLRERSDFSLLLPLFFCVVDQYYTVMELFEVWVEAVRLSSARHNVFVSKKLDMKDVKFKMHSMLRTFLSECFESNDQAKLRHRHTHNDGHTSSSNESASETAGDLSAFFLRKPRPLRSSGKKTSLFKFDASSVGMNQSEVQKIKNRQSIMYGVAEKGLITTREEDDLGLKMLKNLSLQEKPRIQST